MLKYILKRVFIFIPTLFFISLITFIISINAPGDPVESMLNKNSGGDGQGSQKIATEKAYISLRHQYGFDLPVFYFSISNASSCDTLNQISKQSHRNNLERLSFQYGNWDDVAHYYKQLRDFEVAIYSVPKKPENVDALAKTKQYVNTLFENYDDEKIKTIFTNIDFIFSSSASLSSAAGYYTACKEAYHTILHDRSPLKKYIPVIHFYGFQNQYHRWISSFMVGDFGISYQDKRPVSSVIWDALGWTMSISTISIILAYLIAIPLGVKSAVNKGKRSEKMTTTFLFLIYSLPSFWIATILVIFFCGGDYLSWFPSPGAPPIPSDAPFFYKLTEGAYRMALPLFCWTYTSLAFISRQMRGGMLNVIGQDFIRTARAKGLSENKVIWKHAFKNSLIPIITLFASVFPLAISGSFVIENIFSIPGMGKVSLEALYARNYPIIFTVMMFTAILTLLGNLIADILYAMIDPRISYSNKRK